jgi:riboflavin synthase
MFTGIIETLGTITALEKEGENIHVSVQSNITNELKIDQSVSHNGVCLTVVSIKNDTYTVTAIKETIDKPI